MQTFEFKDRVSTYAGRKKLKIISQIADEMVVDITPEDGASEPGTQLSASHLNQFQSGIVEAIDTASTALSNSENAMSTANTASTTASEAKSTSATAMSNSENTISSSNSALAKALEVEGKLADRGATININGENVAEVSFTSDPQTQIDGKITNTFDDIKSAILGYAYPVGSIYMSVSSTNPSTLLGGTWVAWGAGRVPVGIGNNGETDYTVAEETGGSETSVATHTHEQNSHEHTQAGHSHTFSGTASSIQNIAGYSISTSGNFSSSSTSETYGRGGTYSTNFIKLNYTPNGSINTQTPTISSTTATNKNAGIEKGNRQPYITCYMWKRTA